MTITANCFNKNNRRFRLWPREYVILNHSYILPQVLKFHKQGNQVWVRLKAKITITQIKMVVMTLQAEVTMKERCLKGRETLPPVLHSNIALQTASQRKSKNQKRAQTTKKEKLSSGLSPAALRKKSRKKPKKAC